MEKAGIDGVIKHAEEQSAFADGMDEHRQLWIDTMNHVRHDWLNDLQLIIGYVQLRKYDKVAGCVDILRQRLLEEGRAAGLGAPGLIEALMTYRTRQRPFRFEWKIEDAIDFRTVSNAAEIVERPVRRLLEGFGRAAAAGVSGTDGRLTCTFAREESAAIVRFSFEGAYSIAELRQTVARTEAGIAAAGGATGSGICTMAADFGETGAEVALRILLDG